MSKTLSFSFLDFFSYCYYLLFILTVWDSTHHPKFFFSFFVSFVSHFLTTPIRFDKKKSPKDLFNCSHQ